MNETSHPSGVIFLDKPLGWTSRQAVNHVIRLFAQPHQKNRKQRPKAGHAGTLDPLATGMLPILMGEATRFAELGLNADKVYEVSLDLSFQTDTLDSEGEVLDTFPDIQVSQAQIEQAIEHFTGSQSQMPPVYSAIRVDGKRAHDMARKGETFELKPRDITIHHISLLNIDGAVVTLSVACSKGTYIRALARDMGQFLGGGGCVTMLRRISTGGWPEQMMVSIDELEEKKQACIVPLQMWLRNLTEINLTQEEASRFVLGQRLSFKAVSAEDGLYKVMHGDELLGTASVEGKSASSILQPQRVLPSAQKMFREDVQREKFR